MICGIVGVGMVGMIVGDHLGAAGDGVLINNSCGPGDLPERLPKVSQRIGALTFMDLLDRAEFIVLAIPWRIVRDCSRSAIDWRGRTVDDATNIVLSVSPSFQTDDLGKVSGSQVVVRPAPSAWIVTAFDTLPLRRCSHQSRRASNEFLSLLEAIKARSRLVQRSSRVSGFSWSPSAIWQHQVGSWRLVEPSAGWSFLPQMARSGASGARRPKSRSRKPSQ